ncbi:MAG: TetR/AcrR family transcriptional regulator [Actinomycetota bacterium]|nr:TetR/AcrR family transcriptional regulator [Actinomycetota bacterium]
MATHPTRATPLPPAERREALIEATVPLLMKHGTDVTTKQLAQACGVAEGTLFRAFPDKESLIGAAIGRAFDPAPLLAELAALDRQAPLEERLIGVVRILIGRFSRTIALLNAVRLGGGDPRPVMRHAARHAGGKNDAHCAAPDHERINALIIDGIADVIAGEADQLRCTPREAGRLLRLLVFSGIHPGISGGPALSEEQIIDFLLNGVRSC